MLDSVYHSAFIRRIVVALNATPHSNAALETAVHLASLLEVPVHGVFVEEEDVLRAATLPLTQEVPPEAEHPRSLSPAQVQHDWKRTVDYVESRLQKRARQMRTPAELEVVRGEVTVELMRMVTDRDLLIVGKASTESSRRRLGTTARQLLAEAAASVLVVRDMIRGPDPVLTYFDSTPAARAAVRMALQAARDTPKIPVHVLLPPHPPEEEPSHRERVRSLCSEADPWVQVRVLSPDEMLHLTSVLHREASRLIVLPEAVAPGTPAGRQTFLATLDCPVLFARPPISSPPMSSPEGTPPIARLTLTPAEAPHVTPLEILEDFADASQGWQYLEDESRHYAEAKGKPACVLRHRLPQKSMFVDVAFAATASDVLSPFALTVLDPPEHEHLADDVRDAVIEGLIRDLQAYLQARPKQVQLEVDAPDE